MRYTPGQLRDAVGLSKEMFRHWKRVLPGFPRGNSHSPSFSPGDALAFAVLRRLTDGCGIRVGQLQSVSRSLFDVCNETPWELLAKRILVVNLATQECAAVPRSGRIIGDSAVVVCPIAPVIAMLRDDLALSSSTAGVPTWRSGPESASAPVKGRPV